MVERASPLPPSHDSGFEPSKQMNISKSARVFAVLTSIVLTPSAMLIDGGTKTVWHTAKLASISFKEQLAKTAHAKGAPLIHATHLKIEKDAQIRQVKIASLYMVPFIGTMLANHYRNTGSIKGFINNPVFHQLLVDRGWTVPSIIYNSRNRLQIDKDSTKIEEILSKPLTAESIREYLQSPSPTAKQFKENYEQFPKEALRYAARIQAKDGRIHDATLLCSGSLDAPTIVVYHGNAASRSNYMDRAKEFQKRGYNVLVSSYAGDHVYGGNPQDNVACTEARMRMDAEADLQFLQGLGITSIGAYGHSLGGCQAVHLADSIDLYNKKEGAKKVSVSVLILDRTFTNGAAVAGRVAENMVGSKILSALVQDATQQQLAIEQHRSKDPHCDGLDNQKKLERLKKSETFTGTSLIIVGGKTDDIMSGRVGSEFDASRNFSNDLLNSAEGGLFRVDHQMLPCGHNEELTQETFQRIQNLKI